MVCYARFSRKTELTGYTYISVYTGIYKHIQAYHILLCFTLLQFAESVFFFLPNWRQPYIVRWQLAIKYFLIKVCTFLDIMLLTLNRLQCNVNVTFVCMGKPKNLCNLICCNTCSGAVVWNKTHNISKVCLCAYGERQTDRQRHRETDRKEERDDEMETERSSWLVWNL